MEARWKQYREFATKFESLDENSSEDQKMSDLYEEKMDLIEEEVNTAFNDIPKKLESI